MGYMSAHVELHQLTSTESQGKRRTYVEAARTCACSIRVHLVDQVSVSFMAVVLQRHFADHACEVRKYANGVKYQKGDILQVDGRDIIN